MCLRYVHHTKHFGAPASTITGRWYARTEKTERPTFRAHRTAQLPTPSDMANDARTECSDVLSRDVRARGGRKGGWWLWWWQWRWCWWWCWCCGWCAFYGIRCKAFVGICKPNLGYCTPGVLTRAHVRFLCIPQFARWFSLALCVRHSVLNWKTSTGNAFCSFAENLPKTKPHRANYFTNTERPLTNIGASAHLCRVCIFSLAVIAVRLSNNSIIIECTTTTTTTTATTLLMH